MPGYSGYQGQSASARSKMDETHMNWQATLACFGGVIGLAVLVCLLCRFCRYIDPIKNPQERPNGLAESMLDDSVRVNVGVRHRPVLLPSADAEERYYSRQ